MISARRAPGHDVSKLPATGHRVGRRRIAAGIATVLLMLAATPFTGAATAAGASPSGTGVSVQVLSTSTPSPPATPTNTTVTFMLSLTNDTDTPIQNLLIRADREAPLTGQSALDQELADPSATTDHLNGLPDRPVDGILGAHQAREIAYRLVTSTTDQPNVALCLCYAGVYPLDFTLYGATSAGGDSTQLAWAQTYVPSTDGAQHIEVSWLWPLIDRPHRLADSNVFIDDDLAASVSAGGRLDRALEVVERAGPSAGITLMIDPELIDELAVMTKGYRIPIPGKPGQTEAGTGGPAASAWLARLRAVIPNVDHVSMTPYADPDVDAVNRAGLRWASTMPADMQTRVEDAMGGLYSDDVAWPAGETVTSGALAGLKAGGARSIVLDDATLPGGKDESPPPDALAKLPDGLDALVTSQSLEQRVKAALVPGGAGLAAIPAMVADLSMPAIEDAQDPHYLVLVPDRQVDTDPALGAEVIAATTRGIFSPLPVSEALQTITPQDHGALTTQAGAQAAEVAPGIIAASAADSNRMTALAGAVAPADVAKVLDGFPAATQRAQSSAWRTDPSGGLVFASMLTQESIQLSDGLQIVRPVNGSYSLASSNAPLFITVQNSLPVQVNVQVQITTVGGIVGFHADDPGLQAIPAGTRRMIKLQAHVNRSGHFSVQVALLTKAGVQLGEPIQLSISSNALGTIGVVITVVAGAVLVGALVIRFIRRLLFRRAHPELRSRTRFTAAPVPPAPSSSEVSG